MLRFQCQIWFRERATILRYIRIIKVFLNLFPYLYNIHYCLTVI